MGKYSPDNDIAENAGGNSMDPYAEIDSGETVSPDEHGQLCRTAESLLVRCQSLLQRLDMLLEHSNAASSSSSSSSGNAAAKKKQKGAQRVEPINGLLKFRGVIQAEHRFLKKINKSPSTIRPCHVTSSNLPYLEAVFNLASTHSNHATHIFKNFSYQPFQSSSVLGKAEPKSVRVDVVMGNGVRWVKVKASAMRGVGIQLAGEEESEEEESDDEDDGVKIDDDYKASLKNHDYGNNNNSNQQLALDLPPLPVFSQAKAMLRAAEQNPVHFKPPDVVFHFLADEEVDEKVVEGLKILGVAVEIGRSSDEDNGVENWNVEPFGGGGGADARNERENSSRVGRDAPLTSSALESILKSQTFSPAVEPSSADHLITSKLNLDTTTLIALISDLSNRFSTVRDDSFDISALKLQREQETEKPLHSYLLPIMETRNLFATETAINKFVEIVAVIGGPFERARAYALFDEQSKLAFPRLAELQEHNAITNSNNNNVEGQNSTKSVLQRPRDLDHLKSESSPLPFGRVRVVPDDPSPRFIELSEIRKKWEDDVRIATELAKQEEDEEAVSVAAAIAAGESSKPVTSKKARKKLRTLRKPPPGCVLMSEHHVVVFGTGDRLCATTVTANGGLLRSLAERIGGVSLYVHEPRSLIENRWLRDWVK
ncbi:hypothetical protein HDU76_005483 [Blyttiomyces sp. JEL0837]|nr:hypothetical protein HDU76_005483 [Blyttiomyces sp. JEL0837]